MNVQKIHTCDSLTQQRSATHVRKEMTKTKKQQPNLHFEIKSILK